MSVGVCFYVDHDLPTDSAESFRRAFVERSDGNIIVSDIVNEVPDTIFAHGFQKLDANLWYFFYCSIEGPFDYIFPAFFKLLRISHTDEEVSMSLRVYKHSIKVEELKMHGKDEINKYQWRSVRDILLTDSEPGRMWKDLLVEIYRKHLLPIFHSKHVLLAKDSSSWLHESVGGEYLGDKGMTLEEALAMHPCTVIRSDNCFKFPDEFVFTGSFDDSFFLLDL